MNTRPAIRPRTLLTGILLLALAAAILSALARTAHAQVPQLINYQGRVAVGTVNFDGAGAFKFALVNGDGSQTYWSNDGTSTAGSEPTAAVSLNVTKGLYSVLLGDATLPNMTIVPATVFTNPDVRLRVWFNDGNPVHGSQFLTPDQRIAAVGYAMMAGTAATVADGAITSAKIAPGAVGSAQLAPGATFTWQNVSGTSQTAAANTGYVTTNAAQTTVTLPATANVGDTVQVTGGAGGWSIAPNAGQSVLGGSAAGTSWTSYAPAKNWYRLASSADGSRLAAIAANGYIYTSADGGQTWGTTMSGPGSNWNSVASSSNGLKLVASLGGEKLYLSTDGGGSWVAKAFNASWTGVASSADGTHLAAASSGATIVTSSDSGGTWTIQNGSGGHNWNSNTLVSSIDGSKLAVASDSFVFTSADSGVNWVQYPVAGPFNAMACSSNGTMLVATINGGQIYTSTDSGANWLPRDSVRAWTGVASSADGKSLVAVVYGGNAYTSTDSGATWTPRDTNRNWECVASSGDGSTLIGGVDLNDHIYISKQYLTGAQGTTAQLQYLGNGQWQALNQPLIAAGAVGSAQLTSGAVQSGNIATGAVGSGQIANGAIGGTQIAAGAVDSTKLAPNAVQAANIASGQVVRSLTKGTITLTDAITLVEGPNITIAPSGTSITISASGTISGTANVTHDTSLIGNGGLSALGVAVPLSLSGSSSSSILTATNNGTGNFNYGVYGLSNGGDGVHGETTGNFKAAVSGSTNVASSTGVYGRNSGGTTGNTGYGVYGTNPNGVGTAGVSTSGYGIYGTSTFSDAGHFDGDVSMTGNLTCAGQVVGTGGLSTGIYGTSDGSQVNLIPAGVRGNNSAGGYGVYGQSNTGNGVHGISASGYGVYGASTSGEAGHFDGKVTINGTATVKVLTILGADVAEPFDIAESELPKGTVVVIDGEHLGGLKRSTRPYDQRVAGIVSGANGIRSGIIMSQPGVNEGGQNVALSGRVYVLADASNSRIKPGDLLTTSDTPGHAMKATDHDRAQGAIIGKAMSTLEEGTGMVLVLVTLQ